MTTQSTIKRIRFLRKKNRNLLEKLESQSSIIESDLRKLKGSIRGKRLRSGSKDENRCKSWAKRNESVQVFQALSNSSPERVNAVNASQTSTISDNDEGKTNIAEVNDKDERSAPICRCFLQKAEDISSNKINHVKREILRSIDYSPKSTFLRRMRSRYLFQCNCEDYVAERKRKVIPDPEPPESSVSTLSKEESSLSSNDVSPIKKLDCKKEGDSFERIKKFRDSNWVDCHANNLERFNKESTEPKQNPLFLSSVHDKWNERYKVNERLFAEPTGLSCSNIVRCSHCHDKTNLCGSNRNQVVVSVPDSLLEIPNLVTKGKCEKSKIRDLGSKVLTKRPKPCNSMALRYQKGIK